MGLRGSFNGNACYFERLRYATRFETAGLVSPVWFTVQLKPTKGPRTKRPSLQFPASGHGAIKNDAVAELEIRLRFMYVFRRETTSVLGEGSSLAPTKITENAKGDPKQP
jgi:hypothetical protein